MEAICIDINCRQAPTVRSLNVAKESISYNDLRLIHTQRPRHVNVNINVMLTGGTFDLFYGNCDGQNGLHTHFTHQRSVCYVDVTLTGGVNRPLGPWRQRLTCRS